MIPVLLAARNLRPSQRLNPAQHTQSFYFGHGGEAQDGMEGSEETQTMTSDPDPFEQGQRAARQNIPAEANPYQDGSEQHALWAAGHEKLAGEMEANQAEGT